MTDNDQSDAVHNFSFLERQAAFERRAARLVSINKKAVLGALASAGVTCVVASFDGFGDEGAIQNVEVRAGDEARTMPNVGVEFATADRESDNPEYAGLPLAEAIEQMVYDILGVTHAGWEDGEGAYGEITFDVTADTIVLDHNARFVDSNAFAHEF